jgi:hypothetical protein
MVPVVPAAFEGYKQKETGEPPPGGPPVIKKPGRRNGGL